MLKEKFIHCRDERRRLVKPLRHFDHRPIPRSFVNLRRCSSRRVFFFRIRIEDKFAKYRWPKKCLHTTRVNAKSRMLIVCIQPGEILVSELFIRCCDRNPSFLQRSLQSLRIKEKQQQQQRIQKNRKRKKILYNYIREMARIQSDEFASSRANLPSLQIFETSTRSKQSTCTAMLYDVATKTRSFSNNQIRNLPKYNMFVVERNKTLLNFDRSNELELIVERCVL